MGNSPMHHRCSVRIPLRAEAKIYRHGNYLGRYQTRDIDSDGAFVDTGWLAMFLNEIVDLAITVPCEKPVCVSIKAMVIRRAGKGVGLVFTKNSPDLNEQLAKLIGQLFDTEASGSQARRRSATGI
jgi:hypothetical protein